MTKILVLTLSLLAPVAPKVWNGVNPNSLACSPKYAPCQANPCCPGLTCWANFRICR